MSSASAISGACAAASTMKARQSVVEVPLRGAQRRESSRSPSSTGPSRARPPRSWRTATVPPSWPSSMSGASSRAERRGPDQGHQGHQGAPHPQQHDLPRPGHRRLLSAQGRRPGHLGLPPHHRLGGRTSSGSRRRPSTSTTRARCAPRSWCAMPCATWAGRSPPPM